MPRECVSLHIGQAGVQIGRSCWELYCLEHGLGKDGKVIDNQPQDSSDLSTLYSEASNGKYVPRALFVDFEPTVVDEVRTGPFSKLYNPNYMITGMEDSADNFARGHYTEGRKHIGRVSDQMRRLVEACDSVQGFLLFRSFGGGTGSGFSSLLVEDFICTNYGKKTKLEFAIYPSPTVSTSIVEPYNSILTPHQSDVCFMMDNEAIFDICQKKVDIEWPTYDNLNRLVSQVVSSITASLRFKGSLNVDLNEFQTNLVPYPRIHFPLINMSPLISRERISHQSYTTGEVTNEVFEESSQMVKCNQKRGMFMACCLLFRGDFTTTHINSAISKIKCRKDVHFVDWIPTGFKIGLNGSAPKVFPDDELAQVTRSCTMLSNSTAVKEAWIRLLEKFESMYKRRAFVHWYVGEGMEESEFSLSQESISDLIAEYEELSTACEENDEDSY